MKMISRKFWKLFCFLYLVKLNQVNALSKEQTYHTEIQEGLHSGKKVVNVLTLFDSNETPSHKKNKFKILEASLMTNDSAGGTYENRLRKDEYFQVSPDGDIKQVKAIDREKLCGKGGVCAVKLKMFSPKMSLFEVIIYILDVNDNEPLFSEDLFEIEISETVQVGYQFSIPHATDDDIGENSRLTYSLNGNDYFQLVRDEDQNNFLKVVEPLDYTQKPVHELMLNVHDNGVEKLQNSLKIRVKLTNENNHDPKFEHKVYNITISEKAKLGSMIYQLKATDADEVNEHNTNIRYSLDGKLVSQDKDVVDVDDELPVKVRRMDGWLVLSRKVDYKKDNGIKLLVTADDNDSDNPRKDTAVVRIIVEDDNNHDPNINLNCLAPYCSNNTFYIKENSPTNTIALISATDQDENLNGKVGLRVGSLMQPGDASTFIDSKDLSIDKGSLLKVERSFDHETEGDVEMFIQACDHGTPPRCTLEEFKLVILDVNDNKPYFTECASFNVSESTKVGGFVAQVHAKDDDFVQNKLSYSLASKDEIKESTYGKVTYSIKQLEPESNSFKEHLVIDQYGSITLNKQFDFEVYQVYKFRVTASDGGMETSHCNVTVNILDENDNSPHFVHPPANHSNIYMTTSLPKNKVFFIFQTYDRDANSKVTYSYKVKQKDSEVYVPYEFDDRFEMNRLTGEFKFNENHQVPDKKSLYGKYEIEVEAWDGRFSSTVTVFVHVISGELPVELGKYSLPHDGGDEKESGSMPLVAYIMIALACCLVTVGIVIFVTCRLKLRRKKEEEDKINLNNVTPTSDDSSRIEICSEEEAKTDISYPSRTASQLDYLSPLLTYPNQQNKEVRYDVRNQRISVTPSNHQHYDVVADTMSDVSTLYSSRCTKSCREFGHSDACWMPRNNGKDASEKKPSTLV